MIMVIFLLNNTFAKIVKILQLHESQQTIFYKKHIMPFCTGSAGKGALL